MRPIRRRCVSLVGLLALSSSSCGPADEVVARRPPRPPGLIELAEAEQDAGAHLTEVAPFGDFVFVANSNELFAVYGLGADGGLEKLLEDPGGFAEPRRCTTIAIHEPSASLYCGNDEWYGLLHYDLGDPLAPELVAELFMDQPEPDVGLYVSDMVVVGDQLVLARYDKGLTTVAIGPGGELSTTKVEQPELGDLRKLDVDASGRLWALSGDRGLLVSTPSPSDAGEWEVIAQLDLDGPPLGLGVDDARALVGLGSAGASVIEFDGTDLHETHHLRPPGVVSAVDIDGDVAVAIALSGMFAYDLRGPDQWPEDPRSEQPREAFDEGGARLLGFVPAGTWARPNGVGAMLDGRLIHRDGRLELIASDWTWVDRLGIDVDGFPGDIDLRRGEYVAAEADVVTLSMRNPTPFELGVVINGGAVQTIAPHAVTTLDHPVEDLAIDTPQLVSVQVLDGDQVVQRRAVTVLRRAPTAEQSILDHGRPAPGQEFPALILPTVEQDLIQPIEVPIPGAAQRLVFYGLDCAAMWPEIEDLLWRVRSGRLDRDQVTVISQADPALSGATDRWGLDDLNWVFYSGPTMPAEYGEQNPFTEVYEDGFVIHELPSAAHHPTDYEVDGSGRVVLVEREYRGEYGL